MRLREFAPAGGGDSGNYFQALASAWYNGTFDTGSLQKGIKSQEDVERLLNRGIVCPDGKTRKLHIDYNSDFDGVEIYSDDYYEHGDESGELDSRTGQPWGPYDFIEFSDEDLSEGLNEFAPPGGDDGGPDEDEILFRLAKQWWLGTEQDMARAERTLASMGWEIGEDEGSYDDGGVFVVRAGDVNGRSYQSWPHEELVAEGVAEDRLDELSPKTLGSYINKATKDAGTLGYGLGDINARPGKYKDSPDVVKDVKHSFNNRIKGVEKASHRLTKEQGVAEGSVSYTVANDPDKPGMHSYSEVGHAVQSGHSDAAKIYKNNKFLGTVGDVRKQGVAEGHADQQRKIFKKNGHPVGEVGIDRESSPGNGQWYMKYYATGDDFGGYDSMEEAVSDLKHLVNQFKAEGVAEGDLNEFAPNQGDDGGNYLKALASAWYNHDIDMLKDIIKQGGNALNRIIDAQEAVEKILARGIHCGDGKVRKYMIGYNHRFDGVDIQSDDHYEYADHDDAGRDIDSRTGKPWGPYDVVAFGGNELDESIQQGVAEGSYDDDKGITHTRGSLVAKLEALPKGSDDFEWNRIQAIHHLKQGNMLRAKYYMALMKRGEQGVAEDRLDELSPKTLGSYINKATKDAGTLGYGLGDINARPGKYKDSPDVVKDVKHSFNNRIKGVEKASHRLTKEQGVAEGSNYGVDPNNPWGSQGRFVGDTGPAQINTTVPRHEFRAGDRVMYKPTGARATIENLYKNGTVARIHVASGMGGQYFDAKVADLRPIGQGSLEEKSTSQAQFRTMAAAAHDPKFARKVGIKQSVAREFNQADKGQSYKSLPKKAN